MHAELLTHTPVLALPIGALFLFVGVFAVVVFRTMARRPAAYADVEHLPLSKDEGEPEEDGHGEA
jgi:hypothetical protein